MYYLRDNPHTRYIKKSATKIRTGDLAEKFNGTALLKGRVSAMYEEDEKKPINLGMVERAIRGFPYIEECVLATVANGIHQELFLVVKVRQRLVEAHKLSYQRVTDIIERFYESVKDRLDGVFTPGEVIVIPDELDKSFDGKVLHKLYRL